MSSYNVVKTIKGRQYRYRQETWRDGSRVRTRSQYLGPVDGGVRRQADDAESAMISAPAAAEQVAPRRKRRPSAVSEFLRDLVGKRGHDDEIGESEEEARIRVAREDAERARYERVNELLSANPVALESIGEIADLQSADKNAADSSEASQNEGESGDSPGGSAE